MSRGEPLLASTTDPAGSAAPVSGQGAWLAELDNPFTGEHRRHVLADRERCRQARRADRRNVDHARQCARALDHVVGVPAGGTQPGVGADLLGTCERRVHAQRLRHDQLAGVSLHRPVLLVLTLARRRTRDEEAVERGEHEHSLAERRGHRQANLLQRLVLGWAEDEELPLARVYAHQILSRAAGHLVGVAAPRS